MSVEAFKKEALFDLQDNVKIKSGEKNENRKVPFRVVDKLNERKVFCEGEVDYNENEQEMYKEMQEQWCDWYRSGGRNIVRKYYES